MLREAPTGFFPCRNDCIWFCIHQNELTAYYQQSVHTHSQIRYLKQFRFL